MIINNLKIPLKSSIENSPLTPFINLNLHKFYLNKTKISYNLPIMIITKIMKSLNTPAYINQNNPSLIDIAIKIIIITLTKTLQIPTNQ
jgi:hypothetical protein